MNKMEISIKRFKNPKRKQKQKRKEYLELTSAMRNEKYSREIQR